jgi:hypothetical protein
MLGNIFLVISLSHFNVIWALRSPNRAWTIEKVMKQDIGAVERTDSQVQV